MWERNGHFQHSNVGYVCDLWIHGFPRAGTTFMCLLFACSFVFLRQNVRLVQNSLCSPVYPQTPGNLYAFTSQVLEFTGMSHHNTWHFLKLLFFFYSPVITPLQVFPPTVLHPISPAPSPRGCPLPRPAPKPEVSPGLGYPLTLRPDQAVLCCICAERPRIGSCMLPGWWLTFFLPVFTKDYVENKSKHKETTATTMESLFGEHCTWKYSHHGVFSARCSFFLLFGCIWRSRRCRCTEPFQLYCSSHYYTSLGLLD